MSTVRIASTLQTDVVLDVYPLTPPCYFQPGPRHPPGSLASPPGRWHVHLTPTSSSWLNQVERFFALLTDKQIRRSTHRSVLELQDTIEAFIKQHNADPKPFRWTKSANDILASIERFCTFNAQPKPNS